MILTFYSYKGGVGRSMALANVADLLARSGLRVLMVDFDLEAPGLENFFALESDVIRGREGLLDLLLSFKYSMSLASSEEHGNDAFRQLERFTTTVYPARSDGGALDLITAGRRGTDEQMLRYGVELRRFDWTDFYFTWSGELFFEWLRRKFAERYDAVLVDSRTGVTEMGGICAYQLADAIVVLCGPNAQNLDGTGTMVRHFLSADVQKVRGDRPMDVLIVPARVDQQDDGLRAVFEQRFNERFASYRPPALASAGLTLWDLQIPYEPRYAFDEQVVSDPGRTEERRGLAAAYGALVQGIAAVAPDGTVLAELRPLVTPGSREPVETRYDPTTRFAGTDVFVCSSPRVDEFARQVTDALGDQGLAVFAPDANATEAAHAAKDPLATAKVGLVLVGPADIKPRQRAYINDLIARNCPVLTVLAPQAALSLIPVQLLERFILDLRSGFDHDSLISSVQAALAETSRPASADLGPSPYPGLMPFGEKDFRLLFGRDELTGQLVLALSELGGCVLIGPARSGRTSLISAGLIPALRQGAIPGSDHWPVVFLPPAGPPYASFLSALAGLLTEPPEGDLAPPRLRALLAERFSRVVLVVDDLDTLVTTADRDELEAFGTALAALNQQFTVLPVFVLRPEFLDEVERIGSLAPWFLGGDFRVYVRPLGPVELREAVTQPARLAGLAFEPGLVERVLDDVPDGSAALSVLQATLRKLWDEQRDGYLTHQAYAALGGVSGQLIALSEAAVSTLSGVDLAAARTLLLRLVMVTDGKPHRRDAVELGEVTTPLAAQGVGPADARRLITVLTGQSVLALSAGPDEPVRVTLPHEAVIKGWARLAGWIAGDLAALTARSRLDRAAQHWQRAARDDSLLLTPQALAELRDAMGGMPLSGTEKDFADAVAAHARHVDFGLSYARRDQGWAEWIAWQLADVGYSVELDTWDQSDDSDFDVAIADGLTRADRILVLLSEAYYQRWSASVVQPGPARQLDRLVAVRVEPVTPHRVPAGPRSQVYWDVFGLPEPEAREVLIQAVAGRSRPAGPPEYPGRGTPGGLSRMGSARPRLPTALPPIWNVPPRNPAFTGRDALLAALRESLMAGRPVTVRARPGLAGLGTTQLAVEYAYRFASGYDLVWWIGADQPDRIREQFAALAAQLGRTRPGMSEDSAALAFLREQGRWLLVFDDAESPAAVLPWLPGGSGHVLITSRARGWAEVAATVEVDVLERAESVALLRGRLPGLSLAEAGRLAEALGDLPLALAQAAGYIAATGMSSDEYLALLSSWAFAVLDEGRPASYPLSLAMVTVLALGRLRDEDPVAGRVVLVCAFLAPEPIPTLWFVRATAFLGAGDALEWTTTLSRIGAHGLAALEDDALRMHRLTQAILRDDSGPEARADAVELLADNDPGDPLTPPTWPAWARLLPHLQALDPAATDHMGLRGLACRAASYLLACGRTRDCLELASRLQQRWGERLGYDDPHVLRVARAFGAALRDLDISYELVRELDKDIMERSRRVLGEDHPGTLAVARSVAADLRLAGDLDRARELDEDTFARSLQVLGEDHPGTLAAARSVAAGLRLAGDLHRARELDEATLARSRLTLGEDHPDTLRSAAGLALDLQLLGQVQAARELDQDTLARSRRVLGEDHPGTLRSAARLATDLRMLGNAQAARELDEAALARSRRVLGVSHRDTLDLADNLAADLRLLGDAQAARDLEEDVRVRRSVSPAD
jgi:cellulose biosynthesis protein BcsQ